MRCDFVVSEPGANHAEANSGGILTDSAGKPRSPREPFESFGSFFELKDHHADVHIFYNGIRFGLSRYDAGGKVTDRDVEVAKKIEHEYAALK